MRRNARKSPKLNIMRKGVRPEYRAWINMKSRCLNQNTPGWHRYGARGITVFSGWVDDFDAFFAHVGMRPSHDHSLDRYPNNDGNYEPGNVRWATQSQQMRNTSRNTIIDGKPLVEHAEGALVGINTIIWRLKRGWTIHQAISLPPQQGVRPGAP